MASQPLLVIIHTVSPLIGVFNDLAKEMLPGVTVRHILDEPLLEIVRQRGHLAESDAGRLLSHVREAEALGAAGVLVTCSTTSPLVDAIRPQVKPFVVKIDEAMIAAAVRPGGKVGVLATNPATLEPTRMLLEEQARQTGKPVEIELQLVPGAFDAFLAGNAAEHDRLLVEAIEAISSRVDRIVLAQASMARVLTLLPEVKRRVPVLTSPHLALQSIRQKLEKD